MTTPDNLLEAFQPADVSFYYPAKCGFFSAATQWHGSCISTYNIIPIEKPPVALQHARRAIDTNQPDRLRRERGGFSMSYTTVLPTTNRPIVALLWTLTLFALIPSPSLPFMLVGAAANLAANGLALFLLCSRSRTDRMHAFVRLGLQIVILVVGTVALARSGVSLQGFCRFVTHHNV
jgi:hypothetical protein